MEYVRNTYRYFDVIMALFVAVLLISNIASTKIISLSLFTFDGGTLLFPLSYIFGDVITEIYGYAQARRAIWVGFFSAVLMAVVLMAVVALPPASDWHQQEAFASIIGLTPRIVLASLLAFLAGSFSNAYVLAKLKVWTKGQALWSRIIGSTLVGQAVDTVLFIVVAFGGVFGTATLTALIVSNYIFKCGLEAILSPATCRIVGWLKRAEGKDHYDHDTNFTPIGR